MSKQSHDPELFVLAYEQIAQQMEKESYAVVDQISQICQTLMWGDKNNDTFFDYFCDKNTVQTYYVLITKSNMRDVVVAVIKSLTMLLQNIQKSTSINYILSHPAFNKIITADYNFLDDEIIAYYINLLKCVSIRIDETNLQLFFNLKFSTFPMLLRAIYFYGHKENLIRTSVRNIVLGITKLNHAPLRRYVRNFPFTLFYVQFSSYLRDWMYHIDQQIQESKGLQHKVIKLLLDDQLDILYFLEDLMKLNQDALKVIINALFAYGIIPSIMKSISTPSPFATERRINVKFIIYTLIQIYKSFTFHQFLDMLTLMLLGRDESIQPFVEEQIAHSSLITYSPNRPMSQVWENQRQFSQVYSQYVYKNGIIGCEQDGEEIINQITQIQQDIEIDESHQLNHKLDLDFFEKLLENDDAYKKAELFEEITKISETLDIDLIQTKSQHSGNTLHKPPLWLMKLLEEKSLGNKLPFYSEQPRSLFHELLGHFQSSDDTVVFLLILFLKTLRHSKYISHNILEHVGFITPDKDLAKYEQCLETRQFLVERILTILERGAPPYRLGTLFLAAQMLLDLTRVSLEEHRIEGAHKETLKNILLKQIAKVQSSLSNPLEISYVIDFFQHDYRVFTKNTISIWPQAHMQLLFPLTPPGVCQIDVKHNESTYFIEPTQNQERIRRDLVYLLVLKYVAQILLPYTADQQEILNHPMPVLQTPPTHWQLGKSFDLREGELSNTPVHRCKLRMNGKEYPNCAVFEDDNYFLVLEIEENCGKVVVSQSFKYTDEMIEKLNLKILHVTYKWKDHMGNFDLEFQNKLVCQDVKKMAQVRKTKIRKYELAAIDTLLTALEAGTQ